MPEITQVVAPNDSPAGKAGLLVQEVMVPVTVGVMFVIAVPIVNVDVVVGKETVGAPELPARVVGETMLDSSAHSCIKPLFSFVLPKAVSSGLRSFFSKAPRQGSPARSLVLQAVANR